MSLRQAIFTRRAFACAVLLLLLACAQQTSSPQAARVLDDFEDVSAWQAQHTDDVGAALWSVDGKYGKALRLDFDFNGVNGYATAHRNLPLQLPPNYEISFWLRGIAPGRSPSASEAMDGRERPPGRSPSASEATDGREGPPVNTLQFKLIDASGENVWWWNRPDYVFPRNWQQIHIKHRQIAFAWGPTHDRELTRSAAIEFVVSSGRDGGKGSVEIDDLAIRELPRPSAQHPRPIASASSALTGSPQNGHGASSGG